MIVPGVRIIGVLPSNRILTQASPYASSSSRNEGGGVEHVTDAVPSTEMADRAGRDRSAQVGLSLWALAIGTVSLPLATVFRVMAWGSGTAGSQMGSVTPQGEPGTLGYDESGYHIGAGC